MFLLPRLQGILLPPAVGLFSVYTMACEIAWMSRLSWGVAANFMCQDSAWLVLRKESRCQRARLKAEREKTWQQQLPELSS
jgi:hypothetical protein